MEVFKSMLFSTNQYKNPNIQDDEDGEDEAEERSTRIIFSSKTPKKSTQTNPNSNPKSTQNSQNSPETTTSKSLRALGAQLTNANHQILAQELSIELKRFWMKNINFKFVSTIYTTLILYSQLAWLYAKTGCDYDLMVCLSWMRYQVVKILAWMALYSLIHFGVFIHAFHSKSPKIKILGFLMVFVSLGYRYTQSLGFFQMEYGQANFTLTFIFLLFLALVYFWWFLTLKFFLEARKGEKLNKIRLWVGFWVLFFGYFYFSRIVFSCRNLQDSFDSRVKYSELGGECVWVKGRVCWHYAVHGMFRPVYWWGRGSCSNIGTDLSLHRKM